jgi:hypothetical protein
LALTKTVPPPVALTSICAVERKKEELNKQV